MCPKLISDLIVALLFQQKDWNVILILKSFLYFYSRVDHVLKAVVTYTEKLALEQAVAADELLAKGVYLGDLS